jgi:uncharacterized RDD family membrane protein YckC
MHDRLEAPDYERPDHEAPDYPSFLARAGAFLIDWTVVLVLALFFAAVTNAEGFNARLIVLVITIPVYLIAFHLAIAATPGKMAFRMHVAGPEGERVEPDRIILRCLVFYLGLPLVPINAFLVYTDPQRRALHDRVAGTVVHRGRPRWLEEQT